MPTRLFIALVLSCGIGLLSALHATDAHFVQGRLAFSHMYNVAIVGKSSPLQHNSSTHIVHGFSLVLSLTLSEEPFESYLSVNPVQLGASEICLTPLLSPSSQQSVATRCYPLQTSADEPFGYHYHRASENCWSAMDQTVCTGSFLLPACMLLSGNVPQYTTHIMNASVQVGGKRVTTHGYFYLAFFAGDSSDGAERPRAFSDFDASHVQAAVPPPRVSLNRASSLHLQLLDAVYTSWPLQHCGDGLQWAHFTRGTRYCSHRRGDSRNVSVLWINDSGDCEHEPLPIVAVSPGSVFVMDCEMSPTASMQRFEMVKDVSVEHGSHMWSLRLLPWCLNVTPGAPASVFFPSSSFNSVYADDQTPLSFSSSDVSIPDLTRSRGSASISAMVDILNISSNALHVVRLDVGCRGWAVLLSAISLSSASNSSSYDSSWYRLANASVQFMAHLPIGHTEADVNPSWICANVMRELGAPSALQRLLPLQAHLKKFYTVVSWDKLSASHISVTLMSRASSFQVQSDSDSPMQCSQGCIDVCDFCEDDETASDCLHPQLLQYLTAVTKICARLSPPCPGVIRSSSSSWSASSISHKLVLADNPTLLRIVKWAVLQQNALEGRRTFNAVVTSHQTGAGLGNVWHSMISAFLVAIIENALFFVTFEGHPDSRKGRWDGAFSQAVDMKYSTRRLSSLVQQWADAHVQHKVVVGPGPVADNFWACDWGRESHNQSAASDIAKKVFSFEGGSYPVLALANDAHAQILTQLFGSNMDFYLSHFLVSAAPAVRDASDTFVKSMRSKSNFIIGVRCPVSVFDSNTSFVSTDTFGLGPHALGDKPSG